jgi:hypothetical protein
MPAPSKHRNNAGSERRCEAGQSHGNEWIIQGLNSTYILQKVSERAVARLLKQGASPGNSIESVSITLEGVLCGAVAAKALESDHKVEGTSCAAGLCVASVPEQEVRQYRSNTSPAASTWQ